MPWPNNCSNETCSVCSRQFQLTEWRNEPVNYQDYRSAIGSGPQKTVGVDKMKEETVLEEANRIIYGDREQTYGHPSKNFDATAALWNGYFAGKFGLPSWHGVNATDVAHMMMLLKMARELHIHKRDNIVDMAGYAGCIQKMYDYDNQPIQGELFERTA